MFLARLVAARNSDKVSECRDVRYGNLDGAVGERVFLLYGAINKQS
jgi:hypothetical protein